MGVRDGGERGDGGLLGFVNFMPAVLGFLLLFRGGGAGGVFAGLKVFPRDVPFSRGEVAVGVSWNVETQEKKKNKWKKKKRRKRLCLLAP